MAGSSTPVMYWAVRTTLCSILRSDAEQLPYQVGMQPVEMLSMVAALEHFDHLTAHAKSFYPPDGEEALSCLLHDCVIVFGP